MLILYTRLTEKCAELVKRVDEERRKELEEELKLAEQEQEQENQGEDQ